MKQLVFDINEMSDSKEIYGQHPNPFYAAVIYTIIGLLIVALVFCSVWKIEMTARAAGVVRPNREIATVSSLRSGVITQVNFSNGQKVSTGDVLFTVDTEELQLQLDTLNDTAEDYRFQIEMLGMFLNGVQTEKNPFPGNPNKSEYAYYIQFEDYLLRLKNARNSLAYDAEQAEANIKTVTEQIEDLEYQLNGWKRYKKSVEKRENSAQSYPEYERMYFLYVAELEALKSDYETQKKQIEASIPEDQQEEQLLAVAEAYKTASEQKYYQTIIQIDTTIQSIERELSAANSSLAQYQMAKENYEKNTDEQKENLSVSIAVIEQTSALLKQRDSVQVQLDEIQSQVKQVGEQVSQGTIVAQCAGTISSVQTLVAGDVISAGTSVATIIPNDEDAYKVQLYVNNGDIANIHVGDRVKYDIAALPSRQYGSVSGTVTSISADTMIREGEYSGYYLVECSIHELSVTDRSGNTGTVSAGMQVDARLITQEKTILRYLLEKIDIF